MAGGDGCAGRAWGAAGGDGIGEGCVRGGPCMPGSTSCSQVGCVQHRRCFCTHMQCPGMLGKTMAQRGSAAARRGSDTVHAQG
eukprot:12893137-Prorocentrum_lima.AAC.1